MSSAISIPRISAAEYLRRERLAETKSEFQRGRLVAISGASRFHCRIATNLMFRLVSQLQGRGCNVYGSDLRVSVNGGEAYFYPDLSVTCGKEVFEDDRFDCLVNPVVVIEILSASTESRDRGEKFQDYQTIPSLREYVLVSQSTRRMELFRRRDDGTWLYQSWPFSEPPLVLQSIGCTLQADDVYFQVEDQAEGEGTPET
ncbi:MAG: Uma2 family endonuclease [Isosphaeraceae bacterium]